MVLKSNASKDKVTIGRLLLTQLIALAVASLLLYLKNPLWLLPGFIGGLVIWLPNVVFVLLTQRNLTNAPDSGAISWSFTAAWITKITLTIILSVIAIRLFKAAFIPLGLGFLLMIVMPFAAPIAISIIRK